MKKSLLTLAALAAAGSVSAQSSVTLYGAIDNAYTRIGGSIASVKGLSSGGGGVIGSKLGFKGEEDLGGGLKAGFNLEMGLETSSGANGVPGSNNNIALVNTGALRFDRRATISLTSSSFGELRLGRDLATSFINDVIYDPFLTYGVGSSLNFPLGVVADAQSAASLFRVSNAISYFTPNTLGGFSAQVQFAPSEQASNTGAQDKDGRYVGLRVAYDKGPISVSASGGKATFTTAGGVSQDRSTGNFGGSYDFGVAKVMAEFARFKNENIAPGADLKTKIYTLGVVAPVGPGAVKLGLSRGTLETTGVANEPRASKLAVGYDYNLSKRTGLYATVARVSNKNGAALTAGSGGVAGLGGAIAGANSSSTGYDIGLRHAF
jgi:predicted porin